jgi:hypothetical protein
VLARLQTATDVVSDTILRSRDTTWKATTSAYTMLSRMAKNVPSIKSEIAGATELFARRRKSATAVAAPEASNSAQAGAVAKPVGNHTANAQPGGGDTATANGASAPSMNGASPLFGGLGK